MINQSNLSADQRIDNLEKSVLILETQVQRIVSDIESEKGTRTRANQNVLDLMDVLDKRLRWVEKSIWIGFGLLLAAQVLLKL
jgi:hypothetical protein